MEIIYEEPVTNVKAKEILEKRSKETELKYEQNNALEHLRKFVNVEPEKIEKLKEELSKIKKLRPEHIVAICNFLPKDKDELRVVLYKDYNSFTADEITLILDAVKKL